MIPLFAATIDLIGQAQDQGFTTAKSSTDKVPFGNFVSTILQAVMAISLLMVLLFLVWGGLEWILGGGEKSKIEAARSKITGAIIGLVFLSASVAIYFFIQNIIGLKVLTN